VKPGGTDGKKTFPPGSRGDWDWATLSQKKENHLKAKGNEGEGKEGTRNILALKTKTSIARKKTNGRRGTREQTLQPEEADTRVKEETQQGKKETAVRTQDYRSKNEKETLLGTPTL